MKESEENTLREVFSQMIRRLVVRKPWVCLVGILFVGAVAAAQTPTGTIRGQVTDKTGAVIQGASITIIRTSTNESRKTITDPDGRFTIPFVEPGTYTVTAEATGFQKATEGNLLVQVTETRPLDFKLPVGATTETVQVSTSAQALDFDTSSLGQTIQSNLFLQLPDINRNIFDFATLVPGVNNVGGASTPHIGGSRNANNEQLIDGMTNILPENNVGNSLSTFTPVEDSIQEVNVQTNVLPAEYGRFSGGAISLITKGGGKEFHGSYYEFIQQGALDAVPFGSPGQVNTAKKPDMHLYDSGGTIGGPIVRDRAFFFFDFEKISTASGAYAAYRVPDASIYGGDFTSLFGSTTPVLFDPDTVAQNSQGVYVRQPFKTDGEYNVIPSNRISPVAQAVLKYYPTPNLTPTSPGGNNYQTTQSVPSSEWHFDSREDVNINKNWHSFLRYSMQKNVSTVLNDYNNAASPGGYGGAGHGYSYSGSFDNTITIRPTLLAELRYGFSKQTFNRVPVGGTVNLASLGFDSGYVGETSQQSQQFPWFQFGGANLGGFSDLGPEGYETYQEDPLVQSINGSLIKIVGGHTIKVGGEFRQLRLNFYQFTAPSGQFGSDDSWTRQYPQTYDGTTGFSIASFMLGLPAGGYITNDPKYITSSQYVAFYGQDDWKVTPKLTLNLGLRYDFEIPRIEQNNQMSFWDPAAASPLQAYSGQLASNLSANAETCPACANLRGALTIVGRPSARYGQRQGPTDKTDFAPRLGLAYGVSPKVVIRGGAGLVFQPSAMEASGTSGGSGDDGFDVQTNFNPSFIGQDGLPVATLYSPDPAVSSSAQKPYPTGFAVAQGKSSSCLSSAACVQGIDIGNGVNADYFDSYRTPYSIQWNGNVQFAAPFGVKLELGYLGNRGLFLIQGDPGRPYDQLSTNTLIANGCTVGASTAQCKLSQNVNNPFASILGVGSPFYQPGLGLGGSQVVAAQLAHLYPQYTSLYSYRKPDANSKYNAFTVRADKAMSHGLAFTFSFTDGREYDNGASSVNYLGPTSGTYANQYDPAAEWSIGAQNVSYDIAGGFVYQLPIGQQQPFLNGGNAGLRKVLSGWQVSGIENWSTGTPIVLSGVDNGTTAETYGSGFSQRPEWTGASPQLPNQSYKLWFNPNVYSVPLAYEIGNAPRTIAGVNNPSYQDLDLQIAKNTTFGRSERYVLQIRMEAFNAFNHAVLGGPDTNVKDATFGVIQGYSNAQRRLQFAAKFSF